MLSLLGNVQKLRITKPFKPATRLRNTHNPSTHALRQTVINFSDHDPNQGVYGEGNSRFGPVPSSQTLWKMLPANFGGSKPCTHE